VITDTNVRDPYALPICEKIKHAGYSVDLFVFPAGEKSKSRETKAKIEDAMLKKGVQKRLLYNCSRWRCGNRLIGLLLQEPMAEECRLNNYATTLLAAADASVGGKTAIDTPLATNTIGLFNQTPKGRHRHSCLEDTATAPDGKRYGRDHQARMLRQRGYV